MPRPTPVLAEHRILISPSHLGRFPNDVSCMGDILGMARTRIPGYSMETQQVLDDRLLLLATLDSHN